MKHRLCEFMNAKPTLLFYCQHSLGMGHLVRALTLAEAFAEKFAVVFLNGGRFPQNTDLPDGIEIVNLPPLGMREDNSLYSLDDNYTVSEALVLRRQFIIDIFTRKQPHVVLIELFPFGRKKFAGELLPLLKLAQRSGKHKPIVLCSLRDIMVNARKDQIRHDNRARWLIDRYFDGVLVHSDPNFASLEESFKPSRTLQKSVHYTGFVLPRGQALESTRKRQLIVSAGGGMVGAPLFRVAVKAHRILWDKFNLPMTLVAGPFLPEADWLELTLELTMCPGLTLYRHVPNMAGLLASHSISVSQCGYNTVMDILKSGIAALVVPFAQGQEDEQTNRAKRLSKLGLLRMVHARDLDVARFVAEVKRLLQFTPNPAVLDLDGAARSTDIIYKCLSDTMAAIQQQHFDTIGVADG